MLHPPSQHHFGISCFFPPFMVVVFLFFFLSCWDIQPHQTSLFSVWPESATAPPPLSNGAILYSLLVSASVTKCTEICIPLPSSPSSSVGRSFPPPLLPFYVHLIAAINSRFQILKRGGRKEVRKRAGPADHWSLPHSDEVFDTTCDAKVFTGRIRGGPAYISLLVKKDF